MSVKVVAANKHLLDLLRGKGGSDQCDISSTKRGASETCCGMNRLGIKETARDGL